MKTIKHLFMLIALMCATTSAWALERVTWSVTGVSAEEGTSSDYTIYDITLDDGDGHTAILKAYVGSNYYITQPITYDATRKAAVIKFSTKANLIVPTELIIPSAQDKQYVDKQIYVQTNYTPSDSYWIKPSHDSYTASGGKGHGTPTSTDYYYSMSFWPNDTQYDWRLNFLGSGTIYLKSIVFVKAPAFVTRGDGNGTSSSPYLIKDKQDLLDLAEATSKYGKYYDNDYYFKLENDIDGEGAHINPIGYSDTQSLTNFSFYWGGHFNGNGKKISNIVVDYISGDSHCGLFNRFGDSNSQSPYVYNLTLANSTINGGSSSYVGGIAGYIYYGTLSGNKVKNCTINKNSSGRVGALAGYYYDGTTISNNKYYQSCKVVAGGYTYTYGTGAGANGIGMGQDASSGFRADISGKFVVVPNLKANFYYNNHLLFTRYAPGDGGVIEDFPSVADMETTYSIQNATFTYNDAPFTAETVIDEDINVTVGGTVLVSSIAIAATKATINPGETTTVTVTPTPIYAGYTLTSSKPTVATVAQDGTVTHAAPGTTTITATANDDPTKTASVDITCTAVTEVVIGNNASNSGYDTPYDNNFNHSTTQLIYTPTELGNKAGTISAIAFKVATASSFSTNYVKIYMGHKDASTFSSSNDYMTSSNLTLVYSGSPTLGTATGWEKLEFNKNGGEFEYDGTRNLVVVVCRSSSNYTSSLMYYYTSVSNSVLHRRNDNNSSYADVSSTSYAYSSSSYRPSAKFWIDTTADYELEEGVAYTRTVNKPGATVTYKRSFDDTRVGKYQAWFVPFDYTIKDTDLEKFDFFKINMIANAAQPGENPASDDVYIFLNPMAAGDVLYGNKPYVYRPKVEVADYAFVSEGATLLAKTDASVLQTSTTTATYDFYGTYANTTATTENPFYYVSAAGNICKGTTVTVGPYRWILKATSKNGVSYAPKFSFAEGETTGINEVQGSGFKVQGSEAFYNLNGQRVSQPTKGLYIVNGRKVVVK